jgi:hypothetical protein
MTKRGTKSNNMSAAKLKIKVSDLFVAPYIHATRLQEQEFLYNRLSLHLDDPEIKELADMVKDFNEAKIASILNFDYFVDKLRKHPKVELE